mmetsp:Transcript_10060/g.39168  ORF Transcript_10060/g.39168 Transcript_10060/m.39168 type:complete len:259 (-) Transcript_10060:103-879(-)
MCRRPVHAPEPAEIAPVQCFWGSIDVQRVHAHDEGKVHAADRPHVGLCRVDGAVARVHLRRRPPGCKARGLGHIHDTERRRRGARAVAHGVAKVRQLSAAPLVDEDVLGLDVHVGDAARVASVRCSDELHKHRRCCEDPLCHGGPGCAPYVVQPHHGKMQRPGAFVHDNAVRGQLLARPGRQRHAHSQRCGAVLPDDELRAAGDPLEGQAFVAASPPMSRIRGERAVLPARKDFDRDVRPKHSGCHHESLAAAADAHC